MSPAAPLLPETTDVVVIGGGQAGLAAGYYLRRAGRDFVILDANPTPGGSWQHYWTSLRLFSPAEYSSLPGWPMPPWTHGYPPATHVVDYLAAYERRYQLPVVRPAHVNAVTTTPSGYRIDTTRGTLHARWVINATGTWNRPFWPAVPGMRRFGGQQLHTVDYRDPKPLAGQRVAVVGGGNSAAQIVADVSTVADTMWFTQRPPRFLPDNLDGRDLFAAATRAVTGGAGVGGLGDIVMVAAVREARDRGALHALPMFDRITDTGVITTHGDYGVDTIIWCTGFRPALAHLHPLRLPRHHQHIAVDTLNVSPHTRVGFLGYGDWTGPASATLIGVGRTARTMFTALPQT